MGNVQGLEMQLSELAQRISDIEEQLQQLDPLEAKEEKARELFVPRARRKLQIAT